MSALPAIRRNSATTVSVLLACLLLASCSSIKSMTSGMSTSSLNPVNWITPYKIDVIQGNFLSSEQVAQLRPGMTREQVKGLLGTPLMTSLFHADRWDYVFTLKRQGVEPQSLKYTVFFKGDALDRFGGDPMPSEAEFLDKLDNKRKLGDIPPLEATEAQLKAAERPSAARPAGTANASPAPATATQNAAYPPLESPKQ